MNYDLTDPADREDRRKHLELVSNIIGRMASSSGTAKGWSVTLAGAAFGVALVRSNWYLLVLGIAVLGVFAVIDGLYLHNERKFRDLYDAIVANQVKPLSMKFDGIPAQPLNKSYVSWSVFGFYVPLMGSGLVLLAVSLARSK